MKAPLVPLLAIALSTALSAAIDPQLIGMAMPDAAFLAGAFPDRLPAPLQQVFLSQFPPATAAELQLFLSTPGLDPTHDIHEMLFATVDPTATVGLSLSRGVFNVSPISDFLVSQGHTAGDYNGTPLITSADGTLAIAFPDSSLAILGDPALVTAAIDRGANPSQLDPGLVAKATQLSSAQDAWAASIFKPGPAPDPTTTRGIALGALANVQQASAGITIGATINFSAQAAVDTQQNCAALADLIRLLVSLTQGHASQPASLLAPLLPNLVTTVKGTTLTLSLAIPANQLQPANPAYRPTPKKPRAISDGK